MTTENIKNKILNGTIDCIDWEHLSYIIARDCSELFDPELYNWKTCSWAVAKYCPQHFDSSRYNWYDYSYAIAQYCPEHFDPIRFNWNDTYAVNILREHEPHLFLKELCE